MRAKSVTDSQTNTQAQSGSQSNSASAAASGASSAQSQTQNAAADGASFVKVDGAEKVVDPAETVGSDQSAKASRPEWLPENLWDVEKAAPKLDIAARLKEADELKAATDAAKAVDETRHAGLPKSADEYKPALPKGLPEDIKIDVNDPRFKAAQKFAHEAGMSQDQFSALLGIEAQRALAADKMIKQAIAERDAALGPNAAARIDAITAFQKTIAPNDKVAGELAKMLVTTGIIETFERIQVALGSQGVDTLRRPGSDDGAQPGKIEGYETMSFAQRFAAGEAKRKAANGQAR